MIDWFHKNCILYILLFCFLEMPWNSTSSFPTISLKVKILSEYWVWFVRHIRSKSFKNMRNYCWVNSNNVGFSYAPDLANVSRTAIFGPESVDAGMKRWCVVFGGGWVADPQICEDIISQTHHTGGLQCFKGDSGCVSMLVCSNSFKGCDAKWPGERSP